jgi:hypothetical protein
MTDISDRVLLPSDLIPSHYTLEITPNFTSFVFSVNETIVVTVDPKQEILILFLAHSKGMMLWRSITIRN